MSNVCANAISNSLPPVLRSSRKTELEGSILRWRQTLDILHLDWSEHLMLIEHLLFKIFFQGCIRSIKTADYRVILEKKTQNFRSQWERDFKRRNEFQTLVFQFNYILDLTSFAFELDDRFHFHRSTRSSSSFYNLIK